MMPLTESLRHRMVWRMHGHVTRFGAAALVSLASIVAGCSSATAASPSRPTPSLTDRGAEAAPPCPAGSHDTDAGCASTLSVARAPNVVPARDHHTAVIVDAGSAAFLYVIGGTDAWATVYDDVLRSRIQADGSLGAFEPIGKLPEARAGHAVAVIDRRIVISGGHTIDASGQMSTLKSTISATVGDDGAISPWHSGPTLPTAVMHHTCDAIATTIYCIGGRIDGNFTSSLAVRMSVEANGTLGPYESITPLKQSIGFHQAFVYDHALYLAGGLHRETRMPDFERLKAIWRLPIHDDGSTGAWELAGELPEPLNAGSAQVFGDHVYFLGGQNAEDEPVRRVVAATLTSNGRVTDARVLPSQLSVARMHVHQTPTFGTWIYSVGGRDPSNRSLGIVDIGTFE